MKKTTFTFLIFASFIFHFSSAAQTIELEKRYLQGVLKEGKITNKVAVTRLEKTSELLSDSTYFTAPFDTNAQNFDVRFSISAPGLSKRDLYRKILEWYAVSFIRKEDAGIRYQDSLNGQIVMVCYGDLRCPDPYQYISIGSDVFSRDDITECRYTLNITVTDGALQGRIKSVEYIFSRVQSGDGYYSVIKEYQKIGTLCPVNSLRKYRMENIITLFKATNAEFGRLERDLQQYLK